MALINCQECNKQISDKAEICVGCGAPVIKELPKLDFESDTTFAEEVTSEENIPLNTSILIPEIDNVELIDLNEETKKSSFKTIFGYVLVSSVIIFLIFLLTGGLNKSYISITSPIPESIETTIPVEVDSKVFGTYIFNSDAGIKGVIILKSENNNVYNCEIQMYLNNEVVAGFPIEGTYVFKPSNELEFTWEVPELNNTMSSMTIVYLPEKQILRLSDGTDYIKKSKKQSYTVNKPQVVEKNYINLCGNNWEESEIESNLYKLAPNYENRAGFYCVKNYHERVSRVYYSGANESGILMTAIGEVTGKKYTILFTCDGGLY